MGNLIIDITELINWNGHLTGVPRVISEYASRFNSLEDSKISFVAWNQTRALYYSVKLDNYPPITETVNVNSTKDSLRSLKTIIKKSKYASKTASLIRSKGDGANENLSAVSLRHADTLLILADWHSSDEKFVDYLIEAHKKGIRIINFVHDILPIVAPQFSGHATSYVTRYASNIYPISDLVIVTSRSTKKDITKWMNLKKLTVPNIKIIRLGDDFARIDSVKPSSLANIAKRNSYILCVGTIELRKNHNLLYYAYKLARSKNIKLPKLIIVGRVGWHAENIYELITTDPEIKSNIIVANNINDNELSWLYDNALFTIYPSFYEGWGLPVAESIKHGKTCLCSNSSSMPEIAGDLIDYFNPYSTNDCLNGIIRLIDQRYLRDLTLKLNKYKSISWDNSFEMINTTIGNYEK